MRGWRRDDESADDVVRERFARVLSLPPDRDDPDPGTATGSSDRHTGAAALAALDPGRRGVRALGVVAVVVVCVAAFFAWQARPRAVPAPPIAEISAAPSTPSVVVVSVSGRVHRPGLVRLPSGARVADAIEAAGGALPGTDLSYVNLARKLIDGELIMVGITPQPGTAGAGATAGGKVNLNTATLSELQTLPGIGEVIAQRIVEYREQHGQFRSVSELRQVDGIGDAKFQQLKDRVTV